LREALREAVRLKAFRLLAKRHGEAMKGYKVRTRSLRLEYYQRGQTPSVLGQKIKAKG
jgi:hypothetical protein